MAEPSRTLAPVNHSTQCCVIKKDSFVHSKWFAVALLVGSVIIGGFFVSIGGVGLFSQNSLLPNWLASALHAIGPTGCWALLIGGGVVSLTGGITGIILLAKAWVRSRFNARDDLGTTRLHRMMFDNGVSVNEVLDLVKKGADINSKTSRGDTPLMFAISWGAPEVVQALLNQEDINLEETNYAGETALFEVGGKTENIKILLGKGANVNVQDSDGKTPLHKAIMLGYYDNIKVLLQDQNIKIDIQDRRGRTPLYTAVFWSNPGMHTVVKLLLDKGAKTDIKDESNETVLDLANKKLQTCEDENKPILQQVKALLEGS